MSLLPSKYECFDCGGLVGWPGDRARRDVFRKHLACTCPAITEAVHEHGFSPDAEVAAAREALIDLTVEQLTGERRAA